MADANTTRYGFVKPEIGASADSWGGKLNQDYDDIDVLLGAITTTGSANAYVLTTGLSLAAYVSGQSFLIKANFTNSGAATINVDTLGAKGLVKGASTALASGDITSGAIYHISYDGTNFIVLNAGAGSYQPLDAILTALAALSWSSGNALVQFTAADTVSLTLTPSVTSVTATNSSTGVSVTAANSSAAALVEIDRTDAHGAAYIGNLDYYGRDSAANRQLYARQRVFVTDNTSGSEDAQLIWHVITNGSLADKLAMTGAALFPIANDGMGLGFGTLAFSDLFLASGGVINWNNGGVTITHDATLDGLVVAGGSLVARIPLSTETTGTLTSVSANKKILATGGITLPNSVFAAEDTILIDGNGTARTITRGSGVTMYVAGVDSATATLAANGLMGVSWRTASICLLSGAVS